MPAWARRTLVGLVAVIVVIGGLNAGLYTQLAPNLPAALYQPPHRASLTQMSLRDWFVLGGHWQPRDVVLAQQDVSPEDHAIVTPLRVAAGDAFRVSLGLWLEQDAQAAGVVFDAQRPTSVAGSQFVQLGRDASGPYLVCGSIDAIGATEVQANVRLVGQAQPDLSQNGDLTVIVGSTSYSVFVGDDMVVRDLPRRAPGGWIGLVTQGGPVVFSDAQVQLLSDADAQAFAFGDVQSVPISNGRSDPSSSALQLPYAADFRSAAGLSRWQSFGGTWSLAAGGLVQERTDEADDGITLVDAPDAEYTLVARFRHLRGTGGGVVFGVPARDSRNGAQVVRYSDQSSELMWGYLDRGGAWHGQGAVSVEPPGASEHTLEVTARRTTYSVRLDGATLALDVPRFGRGGYVGVTTSHSSVAFDALDVTPPADLAARLGAGPLPSARILSGTWTAAGDGAIEQHDPSPTDLTLDTALEAETPYRVDVRVSPGASAEGQDIGGGLMLGLSGTDSKKGAQLIRLASGGRGALWGYFAGDGSFVPQGGAQLGEPPPTGRTLSVVVSGKQLDVLVDGRQIATHVPVHGQGNHVGLVAFGSPVAFSDFSLTPEPAP